MLDKLGGIAIAPDALHWLLTPSNFKQTLIERIRSAKEAIYIAALYLEDDEAGREILAELLAAKQPDPNSKSRCWWIFTVPVAALSATRVMAATT